MTVTLAHKGVTLRKRKKKKKKGGGKGKIIFGDRNWREGDIFFCGLQ